MTGVDFGKAGVLRHAGSSDCRHSLRAKCIGSLGQLLELSTIPNDRTALNLPVSSNLDKNWLAARLMSRSKRR
jgi:hypothetical protein